MQEEILMQNPEMFFAYFMIVASIIGLLSYVFMSIALMKIARYEGIDNAWLAWVPIGNLWIYGELVSDKLKGKGGLKYILVTLIYIATSFIPILFLNVITSLVYLVFAILFTYLILEKYSNKPVLHTVLSILVPFYFPIILMQFRNNEAK